jgi:hypothetical protein
VSQTATTKAGDALIESERRYQELLKKFEEVKMKGSGAVVTISSSNTSGTDAFVVVLVDANSHRVCRTLVCGISC